MRPDERPPKGVPLPVAFLGFVAALVVGLTTGGVGGYLAARRSMATDVSPAEGVDPAEKNAPAPAAQPKKERPYPLEQVSFKAAVWGRTREQVEKKCGAPDAIVDDPTGGWDGPALVYFGPFTDAGGRSAKVQLWFGRRTGAVEFVNFID